MIAATISASHVLTTVRAVFIGILQGVTELFPISSLGHSVLVPAWLGWRGIADSQSKGESFYLAFIVGLHVATALALLAFYWRAWRGIVPAAWRVVRHRRVSDPHERVAWLLLVATIPTGITGLVFEHALRTLFAKPLAAAAFLTVNGAILLLGDRRRRRGAPAPAHADARDFDASIDRIAEMPTRAALVVGVAQIGALFAGISRSGITMVAGLHRGLDHEDAAHFSFLLATPIILAAGLYKLPDLFGPLGNGIRGQVVAGSVAAAVAALIAVALLTRFLRTHNLVPFGIYCLVFGGISVLRFA